jgi:Asp-tRNA(Asn)/Glu-tRNA(Gln) amidotransferase A subunit family amidase
MSLDEPTTASAVRIAAAIRGGVTSAAEVLDAYLERIAEVNPRVNAIATLDEEGARAAARAADAATARGQSLGPLHGVPFTVKDVIATKGVRTTAGSLTLADWEPTASATAVERLQQGGAVLVGKGNCPEYALDIDTDNRIFGRTVNPWSPDHTPGGSSGGESAALASGCSALGIGTDYGGSIRWPAACTGVVALRPTGGIVPGTGQVPYTAVPGTDLDRLPHAAPPNSMSLQSQLQRVAPMARSVDDLWAALQVMAGPDDLDVSTVPVKLGEPDFVDVRLLNCTWYGSDGAAPVDAEVAAVVETAAKALQDFGVKMRHELPPGLAEAEPVFQKFRAAEGVPDHQELASGREELLTANIHGWFSATGAEATVRTYRRLAAQRDLIRAKVLAHLRQHPLFLLPVGSIPAFRADADTFVVEGKTVPRLSLISCCRAISVLNLPAATVPCGTSSAGLPIGVQVVGRPFHDHEVVAAARVLEEIFGAWRPPLTRSQEKIGAPG